MILTPVSFPLHAPLPYGGGATHRPLPFMRGAIAHGLNRVSGSFLIDSGADCIVLPNRVAQKLHLDLASAPTSTTRTATGAPFSVRYASIEIELGHGFTHCRWTSWVGFAPVEHWLFGHIDGLEHFHFTMDAGNNEFILVPRVSLPVVA